jgi:hypothetical protein
MAVARKKARSRGGARPARLQLPEAVEERLQRRIDATGLSREKAITFLVAFALALDAELQDIEPELGWYAMNRRIPVSRAIAQLAARSLGIEPVEADFSAVSGTA